MKRLIGDWVINWCWIAEIEDHGNGTCTLISYDRTKTPEKFEQGRVIEDKSRNVVAVQIRNEIQDLKVLNSKHVFSYPKEK